VPYTLRVRRDTPSFLFYVFAFFAVVGPGILAFLPRGAFETRRWQESDYAVETSSDDDGDDE
jgi:hypothetical protein